MLTVLPIQSILVRILVAGGFISLLWGLESGDLKVKYFAARSKCH
jgi:hypothetical protein